MGFKLMIADNSETDKGLGAWIRKKLKEKLGNPVIPSKEKEQIEELEESENPRQKIDDDNDDTVPEKPVATSKRRGFKAVA